MPEIAPSTGINLLRQNVLREEQRRQTEEEHADGVRERHHPAEKNGVLRSAARADQVRGDDRLSVARRKRVNRAQSERHHHAGQHHSPADLALVQHAREVIAAHDRPGRTLSGQLRATVGRGCRGGRRRLGHDCRRGGTPRRRRLQVLRRRDQRVLRIRGQLLGCGPAPFGAARSSSASVAGGDDDLLPAGAVGIIAVLVAQRPRRGVRRAGPQSTRRIGMPPAPLSMHDGGRSNCAADGASADLDLQDCGPLRAPARRRAVRSLRADWLLQLPLLQQLEGRDLGEVQHVADPGARRRSARCGCSG